MPRKSSQFEVVDRQVAIDLLNSSGIKTPQGLLGEALYNTLEQLKALTEQANHYLESSEFAVIVANHLAKKSHRRGYPSLVVTPEGTVQLELSPTKKRKRSPSELPKLAELRERAKIMGVDIGPFGTKRKDIHKYLESLANQPRKSVPEVKTSEVTMEDKGPMSAGFDETRISPAPDPLPPKRGFIKKGDAIQVSVVEDESPKKGLRQLVQDAKDIDIASLLEG
jgi:hypothetical protein